MQHSYPFSAISIAFLSIASGFGLAFDEAMPGVKTPKMLVKGRLLSYEPGREVLVVMRSQKTIATYVIERDTKVYIDMGKTGTRLADLPPNTSLGMVLNPDQTRLLELHVIGPTMRRTVEAVNTADATIQVTTGTRTETYQLARTVLVRNSRPGANLSDVRPGSLAQLQLSHDRTTVLSIQLLPAKK